MNNEKKISSKKRELAVLEALVNAYDKEYLNLQYAHVQFITEQISGAARRLGGDYTLVMVLAVLGQRAIEAVLAEQHDNLEQRCMTAARIADVIFVPRETVRRKLLRLSRMGLIAQLDKAGWYVCGEKEDSNARRHFSDDEFDFLARLSKLYCRIDIVLKSD